MIITGVCFNQTLILQPLLDFLGNFGSIFAELKLNFSKLCEHTKVLDSLPTTESLAHFLTLFRFSREHKEFIKK